MVPVTERVEQHMTQRVVEPTIHTHEVVYESAPMHMQGGMMQQGMVMQQGGVMPMQGGVMPMQGGVMPMQGGMPVAHMVGAPPVGSVAAAHHHEPEKKHGLFHKH